MIERSIHPACKPNGGKTPEQPVMLPATRASGNRFSASNVCAYKSTGLSIGTPGGTICVN